MSHCKPGLIFLPLILLIIYGNTFHASWHFDDYHNIVDNPKLHLKVVNKETIAQTFRASYDHGHYESQKIYRPLTNFTFALNWWVGQNNVTGYHIVNLVIHILSAIFVFLTIFILFQTPRLQDSYGGTNPYLIALFTALIWAIHPIQTQAVTYIVQRAASMSAMFYIAGMFFYLKGRLEPHKARSLWFFGACLGSFFLALASKQNSATFPIALLLMEMIFFQDLSNPKIVKRLGLLIPIILIAATGVGVLVFMKGNVLSFVQGYEARPFSMVERLLTEPRIVIFYLSLLFFPLAGRLSFVHDIQNSTSLITPITTLPSILLICLLTVLALIHIRKYPILSFAVLFFFLNHVIESSIIPLELIYEHRNYLPSFFIFLPVAILLQKGVDYYAENPPRWRLLLLFIACGIAFLGFQTYQRNQVYQNEKVFWEDAMRKAPALARPYHNLALYHFDKIGDTQTAFQLYNIALTMKYPDRDDTKANTYNNLGNIFVNQNMFAEAEDMYRKALEIHPQYSMAKVNRTINFLYMNKFDEASHMMDELLQRKPKNPAYLDLKGLILLRQDHIEDAIPFFRKALTENPSFDKALSNLGTALSLKGEYKAADSLFNRAILLKPDDLTIHLRRIENAIISNDNNSKDIYIIKLLTTFPLQQINSRIEADQTYDIVYPLNQNLLKVAIKENGSLRFGRLK